MASLLLVSPDQVGQEEPGGADGQRVEHRARAHGGTQSVLAELLADPDPPLTRRRAELILRRNVLCAGRTEHCPGWKFRRQGGGLSVWCELEQPASARLAVTGQSPGLRLAPGSRFGPHGGLERWLRVPSGLPSDELRDAVWRLGRLAAAVGGARDEPIAVT
jgi:DNA-binding transcriptional MocR family regulator